MELKQGYKQTDLGLIPIDWDVKTLGEIAVIRDGTHQTPTYVDYGVPFYSVESVTNNNFTNTKFITEEAHKILTKTFKIEKGDILMTRIGSIGDCKLIDWDVNASFYVSLALLKIKSNYLASYISHYSKSASFQKETEINSLQSAIPRKINLGPISNIRVLIPTNAEQTAIATALSNIDDFISQTEKLIEKKKAIKQGVMQELLKAKEGWVTKKLGDVCEIYTGKKNNQDKIEDGEYPFFVRSQTIERINSYSYDGEAILVPGEGNIGNIFHYINGKFDFHQRVYKISDFSEMVYPKYVYLYIKENFGKYALSNSVKATVDSLRLPTFQEFILPFPNDINEQKEIAEVIFSLDKEIEMIELKLQKLKLQKQGMMQALLTGKIRFL